jgi:UDP-N-acetylmuramoylalanine--D-glutamate ligase
MNITIFGVGKTGLAVAKKLHRNDSLFLTEHGKISPSDKRALKKWNVAFEEGGHTQKAISKADLIVLSPGVPLNIPILTKARRAGVKIISEIELAYRMLKKPIIAVTGTNGKTTTTTLLAKMLNDSGRKTPYFRG